MFYANVAILGRLIVPFDLEVIGAGFCYISEVGRHFPATNAYLAAIARCWTTVGTDKIAVDIGADLDNIVRQLMDITPTSNGRVYLMPMEDYE